MSDTDAGGQQTEFKSGPCAFCTEENAHNEVSLYPMEDYAATNLDEEPPLRRLFICAHCYDMMLPETDLVEKEEVPGLE